MPAGFYTPSSNGNLYTGGQLPEVPQSSLISGIPEVSVETQQRLENRVFNRASGDIYKKPESIWEGIGRTAVGTAIDFADSAWSSPLNPWGERGDIWSMASQAEQDFYQGHKSSIEALSAIGGGIGAIVGLETLIVPRLAEAFAGSTALTSTKLWRATREWNVMSRRNVMLAQREAASTGVKFGVSSPAVRSYYANKFVNAAGVTARVEGEAYALLWNNDAFNSHDAATEAFWIGIGAVPGIGAPMLGARRALRESANSKSIRDLRHEPVNMAGVSNDMTAPIDMQRALNITPARIQLKESANLTEFLLASRATTPGGYDAASAVASKMNTLRDVERVKATESMQKIISSGIAGTGKINMLRGRVKDLPEALHVVNEVAKVDPFVMHGVAEAGILGQGSSLKALQAARKEFVESLRAQAEAATKKGKVAESMRLSRLSRLYRTQDAHVMVGGSWMSPDSNMAKAFTDVDAARYKQTITSSAAAPDQFAGRVGNATIRVDGTLTPSIGGVVADVAKLDPRERIMADMLTERVIRKLTAKNPKLKHLLGEKGVKNWYTLDMAAEVLDRGGKIEYGKGVKLNSVDEIRRESLRLKAKDLLREKGKEPITIEDRIRFNLPLPTAMERLEDSAGDGFRIWLEAAASDKNTTREMAQALKDIRAIQGVELLDPAGKLPRVDADTLRFNRDRNGEWMRPIVGYFEPADQIQKLSAEGFRDALQLRRAEVVATLTQANDSVGDLAKRLTAMPELPSAMDIGGMADDMVTGTGGGLRQATGEALPLRFRFRDNPTLLAATKLQEAADRHANAVFEGLMKNTGLIEHSKAVSATDKAATRAMLDEYASLRSGWDIEKVTLIDKDRYGFELSDTASNRRMLGISQTEEWTPRLLQNERLNKPIVVDELGVKFITGFNRATEAVRRGDNTIRAAKGLPEVKAKAFYTPPVNTKGKRIGFIFGPDDQQVRGQVVIADSQHEYEILSKKYIDELNEAHGGGFQVRSREQLSSVRDIYDDVQMDWIDPGVSSASAGLGKQTGSLRGPIVRHGASNEMIDWLLRKSRVQAQDTVKTLMHEPIITARAHGESERLLRGHTKDKPVRTIFDEYEKALTGRSKLYEDTSIIDGALRGIEDKIDNVLANSGFGMPARWITDLATRMGMQVGELRGVSTYAQIVDKLGKYSPYKDAEDFLLSHGIKSPPSVRGMSQKMNKFTTAVMLRWLEIPHAALNLISLLSTVPGTVHAGKAPISTFVNVKGEKVGVIDTMKIMADATKDMMHKSKSHHWAEMVRNGDATQSALEYHRALAGLDSMSSWNRWAKNTDKWMGYLTDSSENVSRQYAHFVGLRMAEHQGIKGLTAQHDFAREIANAAIADYAPINRPEMFSSGLGSLVGLFQSYMLNHTTKMFRWMEQGQYAAMGLQAATQATLFGLSGTYGLGHLFDMRDSVLAKTGEPTMVDMMYEAFGPVIGGAIATGSIGQLTGIALWTRGDTNMRIPSPVSPPAISVMKNIASGVIGAIENGMNSMPGEKSHAVFEQLARTIPNRVMRGIAQVALGGNEVDARGNVMTQTQSAVDLAARLVGTRSARQQSELNAFYANKASVERDANRMQRVSSAMKAAIRNHNGDASKVNPIQYFNDYVEAGGNPRLFKTWVRKLLRESNSPRAMKQLRRGVETPRSAQELWRYGAYGAWNIKE